MIQMAVFAQYKAFYPYFDTPSYKTGYMSVWNVPGIVIKGGTSINAGVKITISFSTPAEFTTNNLVSVGSSSGQQFNGGFSLFFRGGVPVIQRNVKLGSVIKSFDYCRWDHVPLKARTNYVLRIEFDENKFRYTFWEPGTPDEKNYEYDFYGMYDSYIKEIFSKSGSTFAIASNQEFDIDKLEVDELGYGVGVEPLPIPVQNTYGRIKNNNSNFFLSIREGVVREDQDITQQSSRLGATLWRFRPTFSSSRSTTSFSGDLINIMSGGNMAVEKCLLAEGTHLINTNLSSSCSSWQVNRIMLRDNSFKLLNVKNKVYAVVKDASLAENAYIVTSSSASAKNGQWTIEKESFSHVLKDGYYQIRNKKTNHYMSTYHNSLLEEAPIVQEELSDELKNLWYVSHGEDGLYRIHNADSNRDVTVRGSSQASGALLVQELEEDMGKQMWVIEPEGTTDFYTIRNVNTEMYAVVKNASTTVGEYLIQSSTAGDEKYWHFYPTSYDYSNPTGGAFTIESVYTGTYVAVQDSSREENAILKTWQRGKDPATWWKLIPVGGMGYLLMNMKSHMYATVRNHSLTEGAYIVQMDRTPTTSYGDAIWHLIVDESEPNVFWLRNGHSGLYMSLNNYTTTPGALVTQSEKHNVNNRFRFKWIKETSKSKDP